VLSQLLQQELCFLLRQAGCLIKKVLLSPHYVLTPVRISFIASFFMITVLATGTIINYIAYPVAMTGVITTASFITYNTK